MIDQSSDKSSMPFRNSLHHFNIYCNEMIDMSRSVFPEDQLRKSPIWLYGGLSRIGYEKKKGQIELAI